MGTTTLSSYTGSGIVLTNSGAYQSPFTITMDGTVSAPGGPGVYSNGTAPSLLNQGLVTAALGIGVEFLDGGTVTNSEAAGIAGSTGVELQGAGAVLLNAGTVTGTGGAGALFTYGGYIYNSATGTIAGTTDGVQMQVTGDTLVNEGLVTGATIGTALQGSAYIRNIGAGAAIDGATGVYIANANGGSGTVYNEGAIVGSGGGYGVQIGGGGTVVNAGTAALISGNIGVVFQTASGTVFNDGTIAGSGTGVQLDHGGTVTNNAGAAITAGNYAAVRIEAGGVVLNAGTITSASAGVVSNADGTLSNLASGVVSGKYNAVEFLQGSGTVYNAGTIGAGIEGKHAVLLSGGGAVTNTGSISILSAYAYAIQLGGGTVLNQGVITADARRADGVVLNGAGAITNSGTVIAGYFGVELGGTGDTLFNSGIITGTYGIYANLFGDTVTNSGTITGTKTAVKLGGGATLINSGTLAGGVDAAQFGGNAVLVVEAGAVFIGDVVANGGGNTLVLGAGGGSLGGIGDQISGFGTIAFSTGAAWTLSGNGLGFGEIITGFTLGDAIILDDFAASSETILTGIGIVLSDGQTTRTFDTGSNLARADYKFTVADGNTEIELRPRISFSGINKTISGSIAALASGEAIDGFTLADALILDGFAATGETFVAGTGIILSNGTGSETIVVSGNFGSGSFIEASDGTNTTISLAPVTLGGASGAITLASYENLVIGTAGKISPSSVGAVAVTGPAGIVRATLVNNGQITGAAGMNGNYQASATAGGAALRIAAAVSVTNTGSITGGHGGDSIDRHEGGGADGADLSGGAVLVNSGHILGGYGGGAFTNGAGGDYTGGTGGSGAAASAGTTLINSGAITGGGSMGNAGIGGHGGLGVDIAAGALVSNTGAITGGYGGESQTLYGGNGGNGVNLQAGASFSNAGQVSGGSGGVGITQRGGAAGVGVNIGAGAVLVNTGNIAGGMGGNSETELPSNFLITGGAGVNIDGGTLITSGNISGGAGGLFPFANGPSGNAVNFSGAVGTLVIESGAVFNGVVNADAAVADVLEVSGTSNAALSGVGTEFRNFEQISFASGAAWTIAGNAAGLASGQTITGLIGHNAIDLTGIAATSEHFSNGVLSLYGVGGLLATLHVAEAGTITSADFTLSSDHSNGTDITLCFYPGTQIAGEYGDVAVEDITPGTMLKTATGALMPVRWVGQSHVSTRFADRLRCLPIRIKAGALGENLPRRDLLVSPDHALFIDGLLIQAGALVNGENIIRDASVPEQFTYYHVELASHELLLAEGVPTESFIDNVDRMHFHNWALHEDLVDMTPMEEMPYPRAKSYRQVPNAIHKMIAAGGRNYPVSELPREFYAALREAVCASYRGV
jgi:Hint domain